MKYLSKQEKLLVLIVLISVAILGTSGCTVLDTVEEYTGTRPYVEIGAAYQIDKNTDYWLQKERTWQCSNGIQGQLEVGMIRPTKNGHLRLGYHHESWLNCGKPLGNGEPEVYQDDVRLVYHHVF